MGKALKQVENFRYLGSVIHVQGGSKDIKARIAAAWKKWKELSGVLCDRRMPTGVKGKVSGLPATRIEISGPNF